MIAVGVIVFTLVKLRFSYVAGTAVTVFPFTVTVTSLLKVYPIFGNNITEYTYFFPLSNLVMIGKVLYATPSKYHTAMDNIDLLLSVEFK